MHDAVATTTPPVTDESTIARYALIAIQGPRAVEILQTLTSTSLADLPYYSFATGEVASIRATFADGGPCCASVTK